MLTKQDKTELVGKLKTSFEESSAVVLVNYSGLSVQMQQELKKRLKEAGARMRVVKNTLVKLAGEEAKMPEELMNTEVLSGQTALVIAQEDPIAPLQVLGVFAKEFEVTSMKVGIVEGKFQSGENLVKLSKLPNKETLTIQAVSAIGAPLYGLVGTLQGNLSKLVFVLDQASKK